MLDVSSASLCIYLGESVGPDKGANIQYHWPPFQSLWRELGQEYLVAMKFMQKIILVSCGFMHFWWSSLMFVLLPRDTLMKSIQIWIQITEFGFHFLNYSFKIMHLCWTGKWLCETIQGWKHISFLPPSVGKISLGRWGWLHSHLPFLHHYAIPKMLGHVVHYFPHNRYQILEQI